MYLERHDIEKFLAENDAVAGVRITEIKGSTPRNQDAWMLVSSSSIFRTIGGGQLESIAIEKARTLLQNGADDNSPKRGLGYINGVWKGGGQGRRGNLS